MSALVKPDPAALDAAISTRAAAAGGMVGSLKSVQTGYVSSLPSSTGSVGNEDWKYADVTISAVTNINRAVVMVAGYAIGSAGAMPIRGRLTSTTNLRISTTYTITGEVSLRWQVEEFY